MEIGRRKRIIGLVCAAVVLAPFQGFGTPAHGAGVNGVAQARAALHVYADGVRQVLAHRIARLPEPDASERD